MSIDADRIFQLLHIADLAKQWPRLGGIHDKAMDELEKISAESAKGLADSRAQAKAEADAKAAEAAAKAQAAPTGPRTIPNTKPAEEDIERRNLNG